MILFRLKFVTFNIIKMWDGSSVCQLLNNDFGLWKFDQYVARNQKGNKLHFYNIFVKVIRVLYAINI